MEKIIIPSKVYDALYNKPSIYRLIESILTSAVFLGLCVTAILAPNSFYGNHLLLWKIITTFTTLRSIWFMTYYNPKYSIDPKYKSYEN